MNYAQATFDAFLKGTYPLTSGEDEKRLRVAFFQGMHSAREMVVQSMDLKDHDCVDFNKTLKEQIVGELSMLGYRPGKVNVGSLQAPGALNIRAKINGEEV